ncbi:MAG: GAF domain-containing protein [Ignavibacteria bacterium]|nr:GAF domain-containing protein [Ignavibacteria bacterium]
MQSTREKDPLGNLAEILNTKNKELRLLYETSKFFSSTLDITELYDKLFDVLRNIVDFQDMFAARFDESNRNIKYIYLRSILEEKRIDVSCIPEIPLAPEGKGILSEAIRKNDTIVIDDYQERLKLSSVKYHITNEGNLSEEEMEKEYVIESAMIVPIKLNGKILGFITVMSRNKNEFSDDNKRRWIETMVNQAAIANKNAILFSEVTDDVRRMNILDENITALEKENKLLKHEVNNRVNQNMKLYRSLLQFQMDYAKDPAQLEFLKILEARTFAVGLIEEKLYLENNLLEIDLENYMYILIPYLYKLYDVSLNKISTYVDIKHVSLPIDKAVNCALVINELVTNSLLHSFPNKKKGNITIEMREEQPGKYYLSVRDNGIGDLSGKVKSSSFSMVFAGMIVKNLKGKFEITRKSGTKVTIKF